MIFLSPFDSYTHGPQLKWILKRTSHATAVPSVSRCHWQQSISISASICCKWWNMTKLSCLRWWLVRKASFISHRNGQQPDRTVSLSPESYYFCPAEAWMQVPVAAQSNADRMLRLWVRIPPGTCMCVVSVVCRQVEFSATSWSLVQRSPTDCGASLCVI